MMRAAFVLACLAFRGYGRRVRTTMETLLEDEASAPDLEGQMKALMENPNLQEHSKLFAEQMKTMMTDPKVQKRAEVFAGQLKSMMEDEGLQEHAKKIR